VLLIVIERMRNFSSASKGDADYTAGLFAFGMRMRVVFVQLYLVGYAACQ
jgi:hypothetical protein